MIRVHEELINILVDKYCLGIPFEQKELIDCYYVDANGKHIACFNSGGDAFMEEYPTYEDMVADAEE